MGGGAGQEGFQSHAGSIEARRGMPLFALQRLSFNPTLVRLRRPRADRRPRAISRFNPTLVRLRLLWIVRKMEARSGFNPTLVRLRPPTPPPAAPADPTVSIPRWFD